MTNSKAPGWARQAVTGGLVAGLVGAVVLAGFRVLIGVELFWVVWRLVGSKSAYSARVARSQILGCAVRPGCSGLCNRWRL